MDQKTTLQTIEGQLAEYARHGLSFKEHLLCARTVIGPWLGHTSRLSSAKRTLLLAKLLAIVRKHFHSSSEFDRLLDEAVGEFIEAQERQDIILTLDSLHMLPFVLALFYKHIRDSVADIVGQVASLSNGLTPILAVCQQSVQHAILNHTDKLAIGTELSQSAVESVGEAFVANRFASLFDLIACFPDSEPAVKELGEVEVTAGLLQLACKSCRERLLDASVPTENIIGRFISGLPVFKSIDKTGLLLDRAAMLAKEYLDEGRPDEVAPSVFRLFALISEHLPDLTVRFDNDSDAYKDYYFTTDEASLRNWRPDPPAAGNALVRQSSKSFNPLSVLANFTSRDKLFVHVHKHVSEMIAGGQHPYEKVLEKIERCARRLFDKQGTVRLSAMLHDWEASGELFGGVVNVRPLVISHNYWPGPAELADSDRLQLPVIDEIDAIFNAAHPKKTVRWIKTMSSVDVDLTISGVVFPFNGVPITALAFAESYLTSHFSLGDVREDEREGFRFWAERGVLWFSDDQTLSFCCPASRRPVDIEAVLKLSESARSKTQRARDAIVEIPPHVPAMIMAMLTNLGPMPLQRIQAMLSTMSGVRLAEPDLQDWLDRRPDICHDPISNRYSRKSQVA